MLEEKSTHSQATTLKQKTPQPTDKILDLVPDNEEARGTQAALRTIEDVDSKKLDVKSHSRPILRNDSSNGSTLLDTRLGRAVSQDTLNQKK